MRGFPLPNLHDPQAIATAVGAVLALIGLIFGGLSVAGKLPPELSNNPGSSAISKNISSSDKQHGGGTTPIPGTPGGNQPPGGNPDPGAPEGTYPEGLGLGINGNRTECNFTAIFSKDVLNRDSFAWDLVVHGKHVVPKGSNGILVKLGPAPRAQKIHVYGSVSYKTKSSGKTTTEKFNVKLDNLCK